MSEVIRNAIVNLVIKQSTPNLRMPSIAPAIQQQDALAEAIKATEASTTKADEAIKKQFTSLGESVRAQENLLAANRNLVEIQMERKAGEDALAAAVDAEANSVSLAAQAAEVAAAKAATLANANIKVALAYKEVGRGALQAARGALFLVGANSESATTLLRVVAAAQGSFDVYRGTVNIVKALAAAHKAQAAAATAGAVATGRLTLAVRALFATLGPVGWALTAVAAAGAVVWKAYRMLVPSAAAVAEAEEKAAEKTRKHARALEGVAERYDIAMMAELKQIGILSNLTKQEERLRDVMDNQTDPTHSLRAAEAMLDVGKRQLEKDKERVKNHVELVRLRDRELDTAIKTMELEEEKSKSLAAALGLLDKGDQRKLERARVAAESGTASRQQLLDLQQLGGEHGRAIVEKIAAPLGAAMRDALEQTRVKVTGEDPRAKAQADFQSAQKKLNETTGGLTAKDAIRSADQDLNDFADKFQVFSESIIGKMDKFIARIARIEDEQSRQRSASR